MRPVFGPRVALFFGHAPVCAPTVSTFFNFKLFENFNEPAPPLSLATVSPLEQLFHAFLAVCGTWTPLRAATGKRFGHLGAVSASFRRLDAIVGSYIEGLWPPRCGFGAISAPGCHFARTFANAAAFGKSL